MANNPTRLGGFWSDGRPLACGLPVVTGILRLVPFPIFNFTPVGALGVFGGARLKLWQALVLPIAVMAVTDIAIWKWKAWDPFDPFVYGCVVLNVFLGRALLSRTESPWRIGFVSLLASILFFVITNFGAWVVDARSAAPLYTADLQGLLKCYGMGLAFYKTEAPPLGFFGNLVLADLFFAAVLFGAHAFLSRRAFPAERVGTGKKLVVTHG